MSDVEALAERVDDAMRRHAESHANSNSPHQFYCGPVCVSEHLRYVLTRELSKAGWVGPTGLAAERDRAVTEALAPVRALADEWGTEGPSLVKHAHGARDVHEGSTLEQCAATLRTALPDDREDHA